MQPASWFDVLPYLIFLGFVILLSLLLSQKT